MEGFSFCGLDLGLIDYAKCLLLQQNLVRDIFSGKEKSTLIVCEHPSVITLGRLSKKEDILFTEEEIAAKGIALIPSHRGGEVTLHSPGQLVIYPIFDLRLLGRDINLYLRNLEKAIIFLLKGYTIKAQTKDGLTGVWVKDKKIASIGIAIRHWIAYHGISLNVNGDLDLFSLIRPCGQDIIMTSIAKQIDRGEIDLDELKRNLAQAFKKVFSA